MCGAKGANISIGGFMADKVIRLLGLLFLGLGVLKLQAIVFPDIVWAEYLKIRNPIFFFVPNFYVFTLAGAAEVFVGINGLRGGSSLRWRAALLLWLSCATIAYKIALVFVHYKGPCGCLLGINRLLPLSISMQRTIAEALIISSLVVSLSVLIYAALSVRQREDCPEGSRMK
jgi:hypothetical protein